MSSVITTSERGKEMRCSQVGELRELIAKMRKPSGLYLDPEKQGEDFVSDVIIDSYRYIVSNIKNGDRVVAVSGETPYAVFSAICEDLANLRKKKTQFDFDVISGPIMEVESGSNPVEDLRNRKIVNIEFSDVRQIRHYRMLIKGNDFSPGSFIFHESYHGPRELLRHIYFSEDIDYMKDRLKLFEYLFERFKRLNRGYKKLHTDEIHNLSAFCDDNGLFFDNLTVNEFEHLARSVLTGDNRIGSVPT